MFANENKDSNATGPKFLRLVSPILVWPPHTTIKALELIMLCLSNCWTRLMIIMYLWSQLDRNDYTLFWGSRSTLYFHHCRRRETSNFRKRSAWEHTCLPWVNSDSVNKCIWRTIVTAVTDFMMHAVAWCLKSETAYVWKTATTITLLFNELLL